MKWNEQRRALMGVTATTALFAGCAYGQAWASQTHILKPGETIDSLARLYHVSVRDIVTANHLPNKDNVRDGRALTIPDPPQPTIAPSTLHRVAKLRSDRTSVRIGPGPDRRRIDLYDAGTTLVVTAERDGWAQVTLPNGKSGWVRQDFLAYPSNSKGGLASAPSSPPKDRPAKSHGPLVATVEDRRRSGQKKAGPARRVTKKHQEEQHPKHEASFKRQKNHDKKVVSARWKRSHQADLERSYKRHHKEEVAHHSRGHHKKVEVAHHSRSHHKTVVASHHPKRSGRRYIPEADRPAPSTDIVRTAYAYRGTPYRYGSARPGGFDCSGFTSYLYSKKGVSLPHSAKGQSQVGRKVDTGHLKAGDLVFFHTVTSGISHVGMYVGNGKFVHSSSRRSGGVRVDSLASGYYKKALRGARRVGKEEPTPKPERKKEEKSTEAKSEEKDD